jgi:hypothetical protein
MFTQDGIIEPAAIGRWSEALEELHGRIEPTASPARSPGSGCNERYLMGLLGRLERKNGWQLAEAIGEVNPQGVQRLLNAAQSGTPIWCATISETTSWSTSATKIVACSSSR